MYPGSFLPGNANACFECNHQHSVGDFSTFNRKFRAVMGVTSTRLRAQF
jgi:hypothetical protein